MKTLSMIFAKQKKFENKKINKKQKMKGIKNVRFKITKNYK